MIRLVIAALAIPAFVAAATDQDEPFTAKVVTVLEGDVLAVDAAGVPHTVRVFGVDSPDEGQAGFDAATLFTRGLVQDATVVVEPKGTDIRDRLVSEVALPDGRDLGRELARAGWAWRYKVHADDDLVLTQLTFEAMEAKRGMWADGVPLAPWDHRGERLGDEVYFPFSDAPIVVESPAIEGPRTIDMSATDPGASEKSVTVNPDGSRRLVLKGDHKQSEADIAFIQNSNRIMRDAVAQREEEKRAAAIAHQNTVQSRIQTNYETFEARQYNPTSGYVASGPLFITGGYRFPHIYISPPQYVPAPDDPSDDNLWPYVRTPRH